jgi:pimeloyl-ACP methyl ester carboxylesterase
VLTGDLAGKKVTVLAHSRGGILIRAYLARHPEEGQEWIGRVITLCSPHHGSRAPLAREGYADIVRDALPVLGPLAYRVLRDNGVFDETAAHLQLLPGNPLFETLAMPADVPDIEFVTFGGTNVDFTRVYSWHYTLSSYLPLPPDFNFDWTLFPVETPILSPMFSWIPDGIAFDEQDDGKADAVVTDRSARLPGAVHHSVPVNHNEALWHEPLFHQVAELLGTPYDVVNDVECGRPTSVGVAPPILIWLGTEIGTSESRAARVVNGSEQTVAVSFPASPPGALFRWSAMDVELPPGEEAPFTVSYHPVDDLDRSETLRITTDDPVGLHALELHGRGFGGEPTGGEDSPLPTRLGVPREIDFGETVFGREVRRTLTIRNDTGRPVQIHVPASQTDDPFSWPAVHSRITYGDSRRITLTFSPQIGPRVHSTLLIECDLPSCPVPVTLVGMGPPTIPDRPGGGGRDPEIP